MIKYFVIIWSIFVTFVTGQQQQNVANYQRVPNYLPSAIELQFPFAARANKIPPNVVGEEIQKIPCPILSQRRLENPNIPAEQPWIAANKWNSVPAASRRSHTEDPASRRSNVEEPSSRRLIADDPTSRKFNAEDLIARRSNIENPISRKSSSEDSTSQNPNEAIPESWKFIADDPISRRSNVANPISRRNNLEDSASRKSNDEIPQSRRLITDDPISQRFNGVGPKSQGSLAEEPSSRRLIADNPVSRKVSAEDNILRRSNVENPSSRRSNSVDSASRKTNEEIPESLIDIADDTILRRSRLENTISRKSNSVDSASRKSNEEIPESLIDIADDPISRRSNVQNTISWRSNLVDSASLKSNEEIPESLIDIADDPISRRSNVENTLSRRSNSVKSASRKSNEELPESLIDIADDPISRRSNAEVPASRNFYSRRYDELFPASRRYPWQPIDRLGRTPDVENQLSRTQLYTNNNFDGPPLSVQPIHNAWQVMSTTSPLQVPNHLDEQSSNNVLNVPSTNGDVQVQSLINYPVEITSPNPSKPINPSDCNLKTNLSNVNDTHSETRRDEGTSRRIMPGRFKLNQVSTPPSVNLPENNQPNLTTISNVQRGEKVADTPVGNIERTNVLQGTSNEENGDRMSIAEIEQQLMEPAKGAGIIKITDDHLSVMDSSRVCYACSSITDPTCWSPERKTTVKYCASGRDSCVTKTYKGIDSLVVIRDCSTACDDALPVLGKKYESCSICGNDLCNNLYVDANGASSIYTRNTIGIMIFSWIINYYFQNNEFYTTSK